MLCHTTVAEHPLVDCSIIREVRMKTYDTQRVEPSTLLRHCDHVVAIKLSRRRYTYNKLLSLFTFLNIVHTAVNTGCQSVTYR